jgi:photosystem II stability/assembly factor-like uncharacterized protein
MNRFAATLLLLLLLLTSPATLFAATTGPGPLVAIPPVAIEVASEPSYRFRGDADVQQSATSAPITVHQATSTTWQTDPADEWQPLALPTAVTTATIHSLIVHPQDAAIIYLATEQGLYRSNNAGTSWSRFDNLGDRPIFEVVQAETDPQRLYIRSWKPYRSADGGATWQEFTTPAHACGFAVAPSQADRLYARRCAPTDLPPVIRSDDGGQNWLIPTNTLTATFDTIAIAPDQPDTLIATNFDQTWRSTDGGKQWTKASIGVRYFGKPLFDRQTPPTLYLGHWTGLLRSQDAGTTWQDSDSVREFSTLLPLAAAPGVVIGGNASAAWRFQADSASWQAAPWQAPANLEAIWGSVYDEQVLYARTTSGLWRLDLRTWPTFTPSAYLYLPLIQMTNNAAAAQTSITTCTGNCVESASTHTEGQVEAATATDPSAPAAQAVERANRYRAQVRSIPLQLHPALVTAAQNHATYRRVNYADSSAWTYGAHGEVAGKPEFTGQWPKDRIAATNYPWWGGAEVMHGLGDPLASVDDWMATVYHRFPILEPYNHYVGYGHYAGAPVAVDVMDFGAGPTADGLWMPATPYPLAYPADGQTDVPTSWSGAEIPNPLPPGTLGPVGYPFTLQAIGGKLTITQSALHTADGALVPAHPNPADCAAGRCLALMAITPLAAYTTYVVTAAGDVSGVPFQQEWRFTTGADNSAISAAAAPAAGVKSVHALETFE